MVEGGGVMKFLGFKYDVNVDLEFTEKEIDHLAHLSRRHYDGRCKAASQNGGFLYGMMNFQEGGKASRRLNAHDLATLAKITEMEFMLPSSEVKLHSAIMNVLMQKEEEWKRINRPAPPVSSPSPGSNV